MTENRRRGRPAQEVKREHVKNVSFTEAERLLVENAAKEAEPGGMPVARWIRERAVEAASQKQR